MLNLKQLIEKAESLDWNVSEYENDIEFSKCSPAGQDFSFTIDKSDDTEEMISNVYDYYNSYDPSEEASYWLDESGHGKNGAPYDMKDLYDDMVACKEMINELYQELNK